VIWAMFKEYFTRKYKHIEKLVQECYSQNLPFTSAQLEEKYKSVVAQYEAKQAKKRKRGEKDKSEKDKKKKKHKEKDATSMTTTSEFETDDTLDDISDIQ